VLIDESRPSVERERERKELFCSLVEGAEREREIERKREREKFY